MKKKQMLTAALLFSAAWAQAQTAAQTQTEEAIKQDNAAFTFTESQLGEEESASQDVIMVGSNSNVYTNNVGYRWSPVRFTYRALDSRYSDIYMNGVKVNNGETGRFTYSTIGGMNDATRNVDASSPFESNSFSMASLGGSNNYNFRASSFSTGHKITLSGANRNYTARAMYSYGTGMSSRGWAFFGTVGYRWANMETANVEGTFYNSLAYFLAVQKQWGDRHSLNLATWGNPTERGMQGSSTDEAYWLANDRHYNPNWGYQNGKKRNSRVVNNYEPSALLTWDFNINDKMKLTTSAFAKYAMYSTTRLNYDGWSPMPDYYKNFPSNYYNVWGIEGNNTYDYDGYLQTRNYWQASKANRQINWDGLYYTNQQRNALGQAAAYWQERQHNDHLATNLASTFEWNNGKGRKFSLGVQLGNDKAMHYVTMADLLGADTYYNVNNYVQNNYGNSDDRIQYDVRNPNARIQEDDRMRYDYDIFSQYATLWAAYTRDKGISHSYITGRIGGSQMWRNGHMENGMAIGNSYGKSGIARFLDGGVKMGTNLNLGRGHALVMGVGMETRAPQANVAFQAPEINNNFVSNLKVEKDMSAELGYAINNKWLQLNLNAYYMRSYHGTEWAPLLWEATTSSSNTSFAYVSTSNLNKEYYGVELGAKFKITSSFDIDVLGTYSDAVYRGTADMSLLLSNYGETESDICYVDGVREGNTPLTAASISLNYHANGWYLSLIGNYYDRIYLRYSPYVRSSKALAANGYVDNAGDYQAPDQHKGKGGFMLDASIGRSFRIGHNPLNVNLTLTNITNNTDICTGGFEQSRAERSSSGNMKSYSFANNPKKFYVQNFNFLLNLNYRF